ncbi:hypothetical protein [Methylobacterium nigriterrae]|uniref:hypothetical protein n=1 Tax=Methylobacterium nigriterrae TaxID=3127512 RepID=UPI0030141AE0
MRLAALLLAGLIAASGAGAEDFTGFYAGVNAGYGRDADPRRPASAAGQGARSAGEAGLPPSAAGIARALRPDRASAPRSRTAPQ